MQETIYIGKSVKTGKWVTAMNKIIDNKTKSCYLIPNPFTLETPLKNRSALEKYKVEPDSVGIAIGHDVDGKTLFSGDRLKIHYYDKHYKQQCCEAKIVYAEDSKIYYMRSSDNQAFLFHGDAKHLISQIVRIGRD